MNSNMTDLWMVKYRPCKLDEIVLPEHRKTQVKQWIESGNIPHLILIGPPGCGKTSLANVIIKTFNAEVLEMNASDERSIDTMRSKVKDFAMVTSGKLKIIFMDEADGLLPGSQEILRNMMETYAKNTRFIFTANKDRFIPAIKDRCTVIKFERLSKDEVKSLLIRVLKNEQVSYKEEDVLRVIEAKYPSLRSIFNELQASVKIENNQKILQVGELAEENNDFDEIFDFYKKGDMDNVFKIIRNTGFDDFDELFRQIFYFHEKEPLKQIIVAEYLYRHNLVTDKDLNFYAMCLALHYGIVPTGIFYDGLEGITNALVDRDDMKIKKNRKQDNTLPMFPNGFFNIEQKQKNNVKVDKKLVEERNKENEKLFNEAVSSNKSLENLFPSNTKNDPLSNLFSSNNQQEQPKQPQNNIPNNQQNNIPNNQQNNIPNNQQNNIPNNQQNNIPNNQQEQNKSDDFSKLFNNEFSKDVNDWLKSI